MKLNFHLYSAHANCGHCMHLLRPVDQAGMLGYCGIVGSSVENDYYCSFYRMVPIVETKTVDTNKPTDTTDADDNNQDTSAESPSNKEENKRKRKKL